LRAFAFCVLAFAAAFDALRAMARCSSFVSALALALPPRLPAHSPVFGAAFLGACFVGIVVNPVSMGHITSLDSPQNGHVTPCGTPFVVLYGPETLNVFWHFVQVTIFSIFNSYFCSLRRGLSGLPGGGGGGHAARFNSPHFWQKHLNSGLPGIAVWPHLLQTNKPPPRDSIGLK